MPADRFPLRLLLAVVLLPLLLAACQPGGAPPATESAEQSAPEPPAATVEPTAEPTAEPSPATAPEAADEPTPTAGAVAPTVVGPDDFPEGVNPLTGLPVDDPAVLERRPVIVKVSNQSDEIRPQSGLSFADHVWAYQTEGWRQTRFIAIYYSQSPEYAGSARSARPIDIHLVEMYDALLVIAGASKDMYRLLMEAPWWDRVFRDDGTGHLVRLEDVPREGVGYYHSLFAVPDVAWEHADERGVNGTPELRGLAFSDEPPEGGEPIEEMSIDYPDYGPKQVWRYDEASGRWLSSTEMQIDLPPHELLPDIDYLTGEQIAFDNVVIIWAEHDWREDFVEVDTLDVTLDGEGDAVLLRDGMRYEATWQRTAEDELLHFLGPDGEPLPFKPGTTWFHTATLPEQQYTPEVLYDGEEG